MSISKKKSAESIAVAFFVLICIFQSFAFAQTDSTLFPFSASWIPQALSLLLALFLALFVPNAFSANKVGLLFLLSLLVFWFLEYIHSYGNLNLFSVIFFVIIIPFLFVNSRIQVKVFEAFYYIMYLMSLFGIIIYVLYVFNIIPPISLVEYYEDAPGQTTYYANYLVGYIHVAEFGMYRLCGLFNEPGLFGTFAVLVLAADRMRVNKYSIVILLACLLTLSFAFFVLLALYFVLKMLLYRKWKYCALLLILLISVSYLTTLDYDDPGLRFFFSRFSIIDGSLVADNRTSSAFEVIWKQVLNDPKKLWFGYGPSFNMRASSLKLFIVKHGLIGCVFIFLPYCLACFQLTKKNRDGIILLLLFLISMYQRPQIFNMAYFTIIIGGILHLRYTALSNNTGI